MDVDGEKAGLWPGLFVNVHGEFRYGDNIPIQDDWGAELFYDVAVTDWFRIGADLQVTEPVLNRNDAAVFGGFRSRIIF